MMGKIYKSDFQPTQGFVSPTSGGHDTRGVEGKEYVGRIIKQLNAQKYCHPTGVDNRAINKDVLKNSNLSNENLDDLNQIGAIVHFAINFFNHALGVMLTSISMGSLSPQRQEGSAPQPVLQGGHAAAFVLSNDHRELTKATSQDEADLYRDMKNKAELQPLKEITPKITAVDGNKITMENLTYGFDPDKCVVIDIKLGRSTYSRAVDKIRTGKDSRLKELKMVFVDLIISQTYKVILGKNALERFQAAKNSAIILDEALQKNPGLLRDLKKELVALQENLDQAPVAFFGHSLLFVMGQDKEGKEKLMVKLIDIGHYITKKEAEDNKMVETYYQLKANTHEAISAILSDIPNSL